MKTLFINSFNFNSNSYNANVGSAPSFNAPFGYNDDADYSNSN